MTESPSKKHGFDALFIIDILLKYKKHLIIIGVVSVILAVIFSSPFFIKPKFKSTAVVYPSNLIPYSTESATEQMLQLFASEDIRDELIIDFDLYNHYEVDTSQQYPKTILHGMMSENIQIDKTKFESVEINVWDTDPEIAKAMVDSVIAKVHKKARSLQRSKTEEVLIITKNQLDLKKAEMDSMENEMKLLRTKYGIIEYEGQINSFSRVYYTEVAAGRAGSGGGRPLDKVMQNFQLKGGEYISLKEHLWRVRGQYNDFKKQYEDLQKDMIKELTYSNVVTSPVAAEKKSYPVRSLIVLMFTGSMLLLSFIIILLYENSRRMEFNKTL
jgi:uncharacterized protein involved in exopolysaccharide biosynthesis